MIHHNPRQGFSLIEILIVVSILAVVGLMATGFYRNFVKNIELESVNKTLVFDLKDARSRAINGEDDLKWGIHLVNDNNDYYELFSTPADYVSPSTTVKNTVYLPGTIIFTNPPSASSTDVIFNKITATTTAKNINIFFENATKTITITGEGNIY